MATLAAQTATDCLRGDRCVPALVRLARELGVEAEHLRARELVRQAAATWSGSEDMRWWKWLSEAAASLGIRSQVADVTLNEALHIARDGALLLTQSRRNGQMLLVTGFDGKRVTVGTG